MAGHLESSRGTKTVLDIVSDICWKFNACVSGTSAFYNHVCLFNVVGCTHKNLKHVRVILADFLYPREQKATRKTT